MIAAMTATKERIGRIDIAIAVVASLLATLAYMLPEVYDDTINASGFAVPLFAAVTVPLLWRRVAPEWALAGALGGLLAHSAIFGGSLIRCGIALPVALLLAFPAGARLPRDRALLGLAFALAIGVAVCFTDGKDGAQPEAISFAAPLIVVVWAAGRLVRSRGHLVGELQSRTQQLRQARDDRSRLEVATERARLSAELDELLQRRLGALAKLAEGGAHSTDPATALAEIEDQSRRTLEEMRAVVGVLRDDEGDAPTAPQPTLTHLEALLVRAKGAGAQLKVEGNPQALPAGVELSAYRIVEQLLDALSDAPGVEVTVRFSDQALELGVAGHALRRTDEAIERTRERVRLHNGTLEATTERGRAEIVVSLPIFAAV
jgi:signal transduction histidine kinase